MKKAWLETAISVFVVAPVRRWFTHHRAIKISLITIIPIVFSSPVSAKIPEPDNVVFGSLTYNSKLATAADTELSVRFLLSGNEIASYQMGSESIGNNYALRIPVDVVDPRAALTARPGETGQVFVTKVGVNLEVGSIVVGERGAVQMLNLNAFNDTDGDGMPDEWEVSHGLNPNDGTDAVLDGDGDVLTNLQEFQEGTSPLSFDTDGDGISDSDEVAAGTDPTDGSSFQVQIVSVPVTDGVEAASYNYTLQANQPNVSYALTATPVGMVIVNNAGVSSIEWTPLATDVGVHTITVAGSLAGVPSDTQIYTLNIVQKTLGDVNADGILNISDVLAAQRHILGKQILDSASIGRGDLYPAGGDGLITISDILLMQQLVLGGQ